MRNTAIRNSLVLTVALAAGGAQSQPPLDETGVIYPLVPGYGGVVSWPRAAEQPRKGAKAVFDITADAKPGEVNRGLEEVAKPPDLEAFIRRHLYKPEYTSRG